MINFFDQMQDKNSFFACKFLIYSLMIRLTFEISFDDTSSEGFFSSMTDTTVVKSRETTLGHKNHRNILNIVSGSHKLQYVLYLTSVMSQWNLLEMYIRSMLMWDIMRTNWLYLHTSNTNSPFAFLSLLQAYKIQSAIHLFHTLCVRLRDCVFSRCVQCLVWTVRVLAPIHSYTKYEMC